MTTFGDIAASTLSHRVTVILVEPEDPRNIGAVARAMSNLGFSSLRLVAPKKFNVDMAKAVACWGDSLIDSSLEFSTLEDAVSDLHEVVGFASDSGRHRTPQLLLEQWIATLPAEGEYSIGLVFGSEELGLRREHFPLCQYLVRIPSSATNRSYNLAQAVMLTLYTLRLKEGTLAESTGEERAESKELVAYTDMVLKVAERVGFLTHHSPHHIRELVINVSRRGRLTTKELTVLKGLFGTIDKNLPRSTDD